MLLSYQQPVLHVKIQQPKEDNETITRKDIKKLEQVERPDPRAETLVLTSRWKKLVKPNNYRMTEGVSKKYIPQRINRMEIKRIEMEQHQTNNNNEQGTSGETQIEETDQQSEETMASHSNDSLDVPAINFKKYLGATKVRYVQMRQASHVQHNNELNLEETIRQAEQKFTTDLKTIATETLVCLEKETIIQNPEEYKQYTLIN